MNRTLPQAMLPVITKIVPRGKSRVARLLARVCPSLQDMPLASPLLPGEILHGDMRENVFFPILRYGRYPNEDGENVLRQAAIRNGDCVWDIGANIGFLTLLFSRLTGSEGRVFAFEPAPRALSWLRRNVGHRPNVEVVAVAASDRAGHIAFTQTSSMDQSHVVNSSFDGPTVSVETAALDDLVDQGRVLPPDYIKMDVEGHEQAALRGCARTIAQRLPVVEFEAKKDTLLRGSIAILDAASKGAYDFKQVCPDGSLAPIGDSLDHSRTHDFLAVAPGSWGRFASIRGVGTSA